jgi:nitroreductase
VRISPYEERNLMKLTRYPSDPITFLNSLRTVRFFEQEPVSQEALDDILEVARWSGSARNRQPWKFLVVRDRGTLERLAALEGYVQHLAGAKVGIVLVMASDPAKVEQETFDEGRLAERSRSLRPLTGSERRSGGLPGTVVEPPRGSSEYPTSDW